MPDASQQRHLALVSQPRQGLYAKRGWQSREIIGTATDITERKIAEEKNRFIVDLNEALLPLADPKRMIAVAMQMLGEHMRVDRCD